MKIQDPQSPLYKTQDGLTYIQIYTPRTAAECVEIVAERAKVIPVETEFLPYVSAVKLGAWSVTNALVLVRRHFEGNTLFGAILHPTLQPLVHLLPDTPVEAINKIGRRRVPVRMGRIFEPELGFHEERDLRWENLFFAYYHKANGAHSWVCRSLFKNKTFANMTLVDSLSPNSTHVYTNLGAFWQYYYMFVSNKYSGIFMPPTDLIMEALIDVQSDDTKNGLRPAHLINL